MAFIAKHRVTGERINIIKVDDPSTELNRGDYICEICGTQMFPVSGSHRALPHFRHQARTCAWDGERKRGGGEGMHHHVGKLHIAKYIAAQEQKKGLVKRTDFKVDIEVPFPEIKRIADIVLTRLKTNQIHVHEVQITKIPLEQIRQRTEDYISAGIAVTWHLGPQFKHGSIAKQILEEIEAEVYWFDFERIHVADFA